MERDIHIALVEDDPELRQLMKFLLDGSPGYCCPLAFGEVETAIPDILSYRPDIILMDIGLPGMSGIEGVRALRAKLPDTPMLMLTVQVDDDSIFQSLEAGASGYLLKATSPVKILAAIDEAMDGGAPMSRSIAKKVIQSFRQTPSRVSLSEREQEVLRHLCDGETCKSIAELLYLSPHTIKVHIKHIYEKMHVNSRAEAVKKALKDRLV